MLKSFILKPSNDILSYKDCKEYPFNLFPTLVLRYSKEYVVKLDERELSVLFHIGNSTYYYLNEFKINVQSIKKPAKFFLEENPNSIKIKENKFNKIKKLLPLCNDIKNIIIDFAKNEDLKWKIKTKITFSVNPSIIDNCNIKNIQNIQKIFSAENSLEDFPTYTKKDLYLHKIIYGIFDKNSYIPSKINSFDFDDSSNNSLNMKINENEIIKTLLFIKRKNKEKIKYNSESEDESRFITEDIQFENIFI